MSDGYLTIHVLDITCGQPANALRVELYRLTGGREKLADLLTNDNGRTSEPILPTDRFEIGRYELVFHAGDYLRGTGQFDTFLEQVPVVFQMREEVHYHIPFLLSPFGYSVYRGN